MTVDGSGNGRLAGKVAVITGTAGGQGRAAALLFAREGAKIVGCDLAEEGAAETVRMVQAFGGEMISLQPLDLSSEEAVARLIDHAVSSFGGLDILYNNAGALRAGTAESLSREDFEYTLANEVTLVWLAIKHAVPAMRRRGGGSIINIGSIAGMATGAGTVANSRGLFAHAVGKGAVIRMSAQLAAELSPDDIRVNCISPGIIETPATSAMLGPQGSPVRQAFLRHLLVDRIGTVDDIVAAALFLASDEASYITAVNLAVDGGWTGGGAAGRPDPEIERAIQAPLEGYAVGAGGPDAAQDGS